MDYIAHVRKDGDRQPLHEHLHGVARIARDNAGKIGLSSLGELLGLLHDLGKYSEEFQNYLKFATGILNQDEDEESVDVARLKGKIDHSTAGSQRIWQTLSARGGLGGYVGQMLALCVASHHSGLINCLSSDRQSLGEDIFTRRMNKSDERTHLTEAWGKADAIIRERVEALLANNDIADGMQNLLKQIIRKAPAGSKVIPQQHIGLLARFLFSCLIDADRLDTAIFEKGGANRHRPHGGYVPWTALIPRLEAHLAGFQPTEPIDAIRQDISRHCLDAATREKGIFTLSVPTGGGKTLASLRFALHHAEKRRMDRIIYVIPFTSIIDQNADVVGDILEPETEVGRGRTVLEHHSNLTPEVQGWRDKLLTENWDAPIIYTTMVQFLETLFGAGTRGARRMHQLANAILIFDEIQSLPIRCVHLFNNAINFLVDHCGSSVVLCTATQPLLDRVDAAQGAVRLSPESELMPDVGGLFANLKRVEVLDHRRADGWSDEEVASLAREEVRSAGSCLVIVNTKKAAQSVYRCCTHDDGVSVFHLSTSLCPAHRKAILAEIRTKLGREPVLCVSTQLIEAGVDVDFGAVIRYAAGLDSIAQAAGRCNRNGRNLTGRVQVVNPRDENLDRLPDIRIGKEKADTVLYDYTNDPARFNYNLIGPEAMGWYYRNYFHARQNMMSYPLSAKELGHDDTLLNLLSDNSVASHAYGSRNPGKPQLFLRQSFMAAAEAFKAIDAPTQGVIVPFCDAGRELIADLCAAFEPKRQFDLLRRAQQYTVNVFSPELARLQEARAVHPVQEGAGILHLDPRYYSFEFGLVTEPIMFMEALIS